MTKVLAFKKDTGVVPIFIAEDARAVAQGNGLYANSQIRNAFEHVHVSAEITFDYDRTMAEGLGNFKEFMTSTTTADLLTIQTADEYRDQYNNEVGRKIGEWLEGWLVDEAAQGRTYTDAEKEGFLDDLVYDSYVSGAMLWDLENDPRIEAFTPTGPDYQDPVGDVIWAAPTTNWKDSSADRDYSNTDELGENPIGFFLELPQNLAESALAYATKTYDALEDFFTDIASSASSFLSLPTWYSNTQIWFGVEITGWWDPLVIDLDNDGIETDGLGQTQYFDLDNDGFGELVGWAGADDGLLARDLNGNGRIDNGGELFGDTTTDGFTALASHDSNSDGVIDSSDTIWTDLVIWQDKNSDGVTQSDELLSLSSLNIIGIDVANVVATNINSNAGQITHTGTVTTTTGTLTAGNYNFLMNDINTRYTADYDFDVQAAFLPTLRGYNEMADLHIAMSIDNTGTGNLLSIFQDIASYGFTDLFENYDTVLGLIEDALYRWAGVEAVATNSRGDFIRDARIVAFLEEYFGQGFVDQNLGGGNPGAVQAREMEELWDTTVFLRAKAAILFQTVGHALYEEGAQYNLELDEIDVNTLALSQQGVNDLEAAATALSTTAERQAFWMNVTNFLSAMSLGSDGFLLTAAEDTMLANAIEASDSSLTWLQENHDPASGITSIEYRYFNPLGETIVGDANANDYTIDSKYFGTPNEDVMIGLGGADHLNGGAGNDIIYGHNEDGSGDDFADDTLEGNGGDDEIYGGGGNDLIFGHTGSDHLVGGDGDDNLAESSEGSAVSVQNLMEGGSGNDTYHINPGNFRTIAYINDTTGEDSIKFGNFYTSTGNMRINEANFTRFGNSDLRIDGTNINGAIRYEITIADQFSELGNPSGLGAEWVYFDSGTINLKNYLSTYTGTIETIGSAQADTIYGILTGSEDDFIRAGDGNDILYGDEGNDTIYGENGNDEIHGGVGDDFLYGGTSSSPQGTDIIYGDAGNDVLEGNGELYGGDGNDTIHAVGGISILDGGAGDDILTGGTGHNTYVASAGNDTIFAANNPAYIDILKFGPGVTVNDLSFERRGPNYNDLVIVHTTGTITVKHQFIDPDPFNTTGAIEAIGEVYFDDGSVFLLTGAQSETFGTSGNDTIDGIEYGGSEDDIIYAGDGDDTINGGDGDDILHGGSGNDTLNGGGGSNTAAYSFAAGGVTVNLALSQASNDGDGGQDTFSSIHHVLGSGFSDSITGSGGNNILEGGAGDDVIDGGAGSDFAAYRNAAAAVNVDLSLGQALDDGFGNIDTLISIENVMGSQHNDTLRGDSADNHLSGMEGNDILDGNAGSDTANYTGAASAVNVDLSSSQAIDDGFGYVDTFVSIENISGSQFSDILIGDSSINVINGNGGDDTINAGAGNDVIDGGDGDDIIDGGDGDDVISGGRGLNVLNGGLGNDTLTGGLDEDLFFSSPGADSFNGSSGFNTLDYSFAASGIVLDLSAKTASNDGDGSSDTIENIRNIIGSGFDDVMVTDRGTTNFFGGAGDDVFIPKEEGFDLFDGGDGTDEVNYSNAFEGIEVNLAQEIASKDGKPGQFSGVPGVDTLISIEDIVGSNYHDIIHGSDVDNEITGGNGNDTITTSLGNDILIGGTGNDDLQGGDGDDEYIFNAGDGQDTITDTDGADDFIRLGPGIVAADLTLTDIGNDLEITFAGNPTDKITIIGHNGTGTQQIEKIIFDDLSELSLVNTAPVVNDDSDATDEDVAVTIDVLANDTDADLDTLSVTSVGAASNGTVVINVDDTVTYTPNTGFTGVDSFAYTADDGNGGTDTATVTVTVNPVYNVINGTSANETLNGTSAKDQISGLEGNDTLNGNAGDDLLFGGTGNDTLRGNAGNDTLFGEDGDDFLYGSTGIDFLIGGLGRDVIEGDAGDDILYDMIEADSPLADPTSVSDNYDNFYGGTGNDLMIFQAGWDTANGEDGNDTYKVYSYSSVVNRITITDTSGNDRIVLANVNYTDPDWNFDFPDADTYPNQMYFFYQPFTGTASDSYIKITNQFDYDASGNVSLAVETFEFADGTVVDFKNDYVIEGTTAAETINGTANAEFILSSHGGDIVNAGAGDDYMRGGDGVDTLHGDAGDDAIFGYAGDDTLYGGAGNDDINGEDGDDILYGDDGNDTIRDTSGSNEFYGGLGNDNLIGGSGQDIFSAGLGTDSATGGSGNDLFVYSGGADTYKDNNGVESVHITGGSTINDISIVNYSNDEAKIIVGFGSIILDRQRNSNDRYHFENLKFDDGFETDQLEDYQNWNWGTVSSDTITGSANNDVIIGKDGNDTLDGEAGDDDIHGGAGDDLLYGGSGNDLIFGGVGADSFIFENGTTTDYSDIIGDFSTGEGDVLDIAGLLTGYDPLTDLISNFVQITDNGTDSFLAVDSDGGADNFVQIAQLNSVTGLTDEEALETSGNLITV